MKNLNINQLAKITLITLKKTLIHTKNSCKSQSNYFKDLQEHLLSQQFLSDCETAYNISILF